MEDFEGRIPLLQSLVRRTQEVSPATRVIDVVEVFRRDKSLMAVPVVSEGRYAGVISRKELFFKWLSNKYALDLFGKKPISLLLEQNDLAMEPELDVNSALQRLLAADPCLEADCFPVKKGETCLGIVSVSDLMMEMSRTQSLLLHDLSSMSARIRDEVAQARRIQQDLLPPSNLRFKGLVVDGGVTSSTEVSGDFFDYFPVDGSSLGLIIADVSGHGVQAGMVTTAAKASLHSLVGRGVTTPGDLLSGINRAVMSATGTTLLMTCLIAVIDVTGNRMSLANAGHNFPYLFRSTDGRLEQIDSVSGFPLGLDAESRFHEYSIPFGEGDILVLYTDGLIECTNRKGEMFGYERLGELLLMHMDQTPERLRATILRGLEEYRENAPLEDDVTLLVARRDG
ncbi:MAG: SpoIIE family protein phosphatase [Geobacteraceae bacterium]|nr:SpoIIE family protein phosphatase [Geobacteraceae bacterium]